MQLRKLYGLIAIACLLLGCKRDDRDILFDLVYPNIVFDIPAGLNSGVAPRVFELDDIRSGIQEQLNAQGLSLEEVSRIEPISATLTNLDRSFEYDFMREISIHVCERNSAQCNNVDEVFYIDNIYRRAGTEVDLLPSLIDAKRALQHERFKLEVWFYLSEISPATIPTRLSMRFQAIR